MQPLRLPVRFVIALGSPELLDISECCLAFHGGETKILGQSNTNIGPQRKEWLILSVTL